MRSVLLICLLLCFFPAAVSQNAFGQRSNQALSGSGQADTAPDFSGEPAQWHGFDRFDFLMDESTLKVTPFRASEGEGITIGNPVQGHLRCVVVVPKDVATGRPWSWRGRYFDHEPQAEIELLKRGFHVAFIQSDEVTHWDAWYLFLTNTHGLFAKPAFVGMSGGGRNSFTWATTYPDRVSCIYADNPLITRESLMQLDELVRRDVPLLHICGSLDPLSVNHTLPIEAIYQHLGGRISVMIKDGVGHHPHSLRDPTIIVDFITQSLKPTEPAPEFAGQEFTRSSFYGVEDRYSQFPAEDMHITCRGAIFSGTFDRYEFKPEGISGNVHVIVPAKAAAGKPWVLRADPALRDAVVDLALLREGFHIVRAPRPRDPSRTQMQEWQAFYEYLVAHGFSARQVLEGAGGAAGEIYEWAIANPDKVSCIYGENPVLRHYSSSAQPIDHLAPLATADVPILHVCGGLDPWFDTQARVVEKRYQQLGGRITVIVKEGAGHYPLAPDDLQPVLEFIVKSVVDGNSRKAATEGTTP
jgi:pimeloyl-ACP methyl ester carboxylesterase